MLKELQVHNFAIIDNIHIDLKDGLVILSGETGAGKSVFLKSLSLLMGLKGSADSIRQGCESASVEGRFDISSRKDIRNKLSEMGIDADGDDLLVRRVLFADKSKTYMNGSMVTLQSLRDVVSPLIELAGNSIPLIELTGQHESKNLLSKIFQLDILDRFAGLLEQRKQFSEKMSLLKNTENQYETLLSEENTRIQKLDFLRYQCKEIESLGIRPQEEKFLEQEISVLKNSTKWAEFFESTDFMLHESETPILASIGHIIQKGRTLVDGEEGLFVQKLNQMQEAKTLLTDAFDEIRQKFGKIEFDPEKLENLQDRLSQFRKLQKKFGSTSEEILSTLEKIRLEVSQLENFEGSLADLKKSIQQQKLVLQELALKISEKREKFRKILEAKVNEELLDLNMKGVKFAIGIEKKNQLGPMGMDDIEFYCIFGKNEPQRSLSKVASGGELSRILLSIKSAIGSSDQPRTQLFDEVDTGVSGPTAEKVGKKLRSIAKGQQVICITHLPQVAMFANDHLLIQKSQIKGKVSMSISRLSDQQRTQEIARLISGEKLSATSLAHAAELIQQGQS